MQDYFTDGFPSGGVGPPLDSEQNWHLTNSTEQNGLTTLKFYRKRNTTDAKDIAIEVNILMITTMICTSQLIYLLHQRDFSATVSNTLKKQNMFTGGRHSPPLAI